jgi:hypothetical protein
MRHVAHVLGLGYQELQDKIARQEIKVMIANGLAGSNWRDEDENAVF